MPKLVKLLPGGWLLLGTATNPPTASVGLTITIPGGKAKGSAALAAQAKTKTGKKTKKPMVIGKAQIKIAAGKTVKLRLKLSAAAQALLKKGALHAKLTIVAVSSSGAKQSESIALTIELPKRKKKGKK